MTLQETAQSTKQIGFDTGASLTALLLNTELQDDFDDLSFRNRLMHEFLKGYSKGLMVGMENEAAIVFGKSKEFKYAVRNMDSTAIPLILDKLESDSVWRYMFNKKSIDIPNLRMVHRQGHNSYKTQPHIYPF